MTEIGLDPTELLLLTDTGAGARPKPPTRLMAPANRGVAVEARRRRHVYPLPGDVMASHDVVASRVTPCAARDIGLAEEDVPSHELETIEHFFIHYRDLEPSKFVNAGDWAGRQAAEAEVERSLERFRGRDS